MTGPAPAGGFFYVNPKKVEQISPFRYPGGKSWLVPAFHNWLAALPDKPDLLLEPFAGGASIGLSAAAAGLAGRVHLVEADPDVAAVWHVAINAPAADLNALCDRIARFTADRDHVTDTLSGHRQGWVEVAFRTIVKNRCTRAGILTGRAGLLRAGEHGRGVASRWYPATLTARLRRVRALADAGRLAFTHGDGIAEIEAAPDACLFVDPPYTATDGGAGRRLYTHHTVSHDELFDALAAHTGAVCATYDDTDLVRALAARAGLAAHPVAMTSAHHATRREIVLTKPAAALAAVDGKAA